MFRQNRAENLQDRAENPSAPSSSLSSLELSDTKVCEPQMQARLGTASHSYEELVTLATQPTALPSPSTS